MLFHVSFQRHALLRQFGLDFSSIGLTSSLCLTFSIGNDASSFLSSLGHTSAPEVGEKHSIDGDAGTKRHYGYQNNRSCIHISNCCCAKSPAKASCLGRKCASLRYRMIKDL